MNCKNKGEAIVRGTKLRGVGQGGEGGGGGLENAYCKTINICLGLNSQQ